MSSAVQAASMEDPSVMTVDPSGVVGVTIAETRGRSVNRIEASILFFCCLLIVCSSRVKVQGQGRKSVIGSRDRVRVKECIDEE